MKKKFLYIFLTFLLINPTFAENNFPDYSTNSLDENINKYNWKVDNVRGTITSDIYYLLNNDRILNCVVTLIKDHISTHCKAP